jgi:hypothetical protein|tara:strand:- start:685 stop:1074 length:390 start_codon:yes stop_codon:yes gene_type:complete
MTAPNLKNPTTITGKTECVGIGTTATVGILTNLQSSNKVLKINSVFAANVSVSNMLVNVAIANTVGTAFTTHIAKDLIVVPNTTQVVSSKDTYFYLEEGQTLKTQVQIAGTSYLSSNGVEFVIGYEDIS